MVEQRDVVEVRRRVRARHVDMWECKADELRVALREANEGIERGEVVAVEWFRIVLDARDIKLKLKKVGPRLCEVQELGVVDRDVVREAIDADPDVREVVHRERWGEEVGEARELAEDRFFNAQLEPMDGGRDLREGGVDEGDVFIRVAEPVVDLEGEGFKTLWIGESEKMA